MHFERHLQINVQQRRVTGIWLYFWNVDELVDMHPSLETEKWQIRGGTTIGEFQKLMELNEIRGELFDPLTFEEQKCILLESSVHALWSTNGLQKILLNADWPNSK